jgi:hypothetical protein
MTQRRPLVTISDMNGRSEVTRLALYPQPAAIGEKGKSLKIRRYTLTRIAPSSVDKQRFEHLKRSHD